MTGVSFFSSKPPALLRAPAPRFGWKHEKQIDAPFFFKKLTPQLFQALEEFAALEKTRLPSVSTTERSEAAGVTITKELVLHKGMLDEPTFLTMAIKHEVGIKPGTKKMFSTTFYTFNKEGSYVFDQLGENTLLNREQLAQQLAEFIQAIAWGEHSAVIRTESKEIRTATQAAFQRLAKMTDWALYK